MIAQKSNQMTSAELNVWIETAQSCDSSENKVIFCPNKEMFKAFCKPKQRGEKTEENPFAKSMTSALCDTLYDKANSHTFGKIVLLFYHDLLERLRKNRFLLFHLNMKNFYVSIDGGRSLSMAYSWDPILNKNSDLDITICINPFLDDKTFDQIFEAVQNIVHQALSAHKKVLDNMFFFDRVNDNVKKPLTKDEILEFKRLYIDRVQSESEKTGVQYFSPFENNEMRNAASTLSFILEDNISEASQGEVVMHIQVPHLPGSERLPLPKSPIFVSKNHIEPGETTVKLGNTDVKINRNLYIYRLKMNNLVEQPANKIKMTLDVLEDGYVKLYVDQTKRLQIVPAEMIDITIPMKNDTELLDKWMNERVIEYVDPVTNGVFHIPDIYSSMRELQKMLTIYNCPLKRDQRLAKLQRLDYYLKNTIVQG